MAIFDQIRTEPIQQFTGSYSDDVYVGNIYQISSDLSGGFTRQRIVSAATKTFSNNIFNNKNLTYNQRLQLFSGSQRPGLSSVKYSQAFSVTEKIFDSFAASPVDIAKTNGVVFPYLADSGSLQGSTLHGIPGAVNNAVSLFLSDKSTFAIQQSSTALSDFVDQDWTISKWPFRRKYSTLNRIFKPSTKLSSFVEQTKDFAGNTITPVSKSNNLGSVYYVTDNRIENHFPFLQSAISSSTGVDFKHIPIPGTGSINVNFNNIDACLAPDASTGDNTLALLAVGGEGCIYKSVDGDGVFWENVTSPSLLQTYSDEELNGSAHSVSTSNNFTTWVVVGTSGIIFTNSQRNPTSSGWIDRTTASISNELNSVAYNDPLGQASSTAQNFVAVGGSSTIITSSNSNGTTWLALDSGAKPATSTILYSISFCSSSQNFIIGGNTVIWRSDDAIGSNWTEVLAVASYAFTHVATNDTNTCISVAEGPAPFGYQVAYRSTDGGTNWTQVIPAGSYLAAAGRFSGVSAGRVEDDFDWVISRTLGTDKTIGMLISRDDGVTWETNVDADFTTPSEASLQRVKATTFNAQTGLFASLPRYFFSAGERQIDRNLIFRTADYASNAYYTGSNGNLHNEIVSLEKRGAKPGKLLGLTTIATDINELYRAYYGIGDGFSVDFSDQGPLLDNNATTKQSNVYLRKKSINILDHTIYNPTTLQGSIESIRVHGTIIRGWGYGLYNAFPTSTKVIWQQGKYGQFRDMLEQRLYTKMYNSKFELLGGGAPLQSPVLITFVSGSNASTLSVSQSISNPTDSGQFDIEYKAGQPFFDDINLTAFRETY